MFNCLHALLVHYGYGVVFLVVFLNNCGLPIPGDMTVLGAGILSEKGVLSLWATIAVGTIACFLGGDAGYWIGAHLGPRLLKKLRRFQHDPQREGYLERFYKKYGAKTVFFARFVVLLHPITGLLAGVGKIPWRPFLLYNLAGSAGFASIYAMGGYFFGQRWGFFRTCLGPVAVYVILIVAALVILGLSLRNSIRDFFAGFSTRSPKAPVEPGPKG